MALMKFRRAAPNKPLPMEYNPRKVFIQLMGEGDTAAERDAALRRVDDAWQLDLAAMEAALTPHTRLFLLCHPHNPVGRVWRRGGGL